MAADTFATSSRQFYMALDHYTKELPVEADKAMRREFRILIQRIMAWTPPHGKSSGSNKDDALRIGEAAVRRDIMYWIQVCSPGFLEFLQAGKLGWWVHRPLRRKDGTVYVIDSDLIDPSGSSLAAEHARRRDTRGRVPMASSKRQTKDIGRHTPRDTVMTTFAAADRYVKKMQQDVGIAKSGWIPAFAALGGNSQAWIARHGGNGTFRGDLGKQGVHLVAENHANSIGSISPRIVESSINAQRKAMIRELEKAEESAKFKARLMRDIAKS